MTEIDSLKEKLIRLHLKAMAQQLDEVLLEAQQKNQSLLSAVQRLVDIELERRRQSAIKLRWNHSKLPDTVTIDQFDFEHHKSRKEQKNRILSLLDLEFVRGRSDVILIGNPGTGKTFIAKCIASAACNANMKVLFTSAMDMINHLIAAEADHSLLKKLSVTTLVFAGVDSDVCVRDTAAHGFALGYTPVFAREALAADNELAHAGALQSLAEHYGQVVSVDEIVAIWCGENRTK